MEHIVQGYEKRKETLKEYLKAKTFSHVYGLFSSSATLKVIDAAEKITTSGSIFVCFRNVASVWLYHGESNRENSFLIENPDKDVIKHASLDNKIFYCTTEQMIDVYFALQRNKILSKIGCLIIDDWDIYDLRLT